MKVTLRPLFVFTMLLAGWVKAAEPPTAPVIFVPGYSASNPVPGTAMDFAFRRGISPTKLELSGVYGPLQRTLENAGYVEGKTFFGAVYDWRMLAAPGDKHDDGILSNVTARSITRNDFSYGVNYLGHWLKAAVKANPGLKYVDIVTHSTGGILTRSYIQSPAYGALFKDDEGKLRRLPKVRYLILGACPNEGAPHSWRAWHSDFQDALEANSQTKTEMRYAALAYSYVSLGGRIVGPDHIITRADLLKTAKDKSVQVDPTRFFRLYDPLRQSLMPTNAFLKPAGNRRRININDVPYLRSDVLLDLNARSKHGVNPWLKRVGTSNGGGGAYATYATGARVASKSIDFVVPGLVNKNDFITTVIGITELPKDRGFFVPLIAFLASPNPKPIPVADSPFRRTGTVESTPILAGDGNSPFTSYRSTLGGDHRIKIVQWGNGAMPPGLPDNKRWTNETNYPVFHQVLFYNPNVRQFLITVLTGQPPAKEPVVTKAELAEIEKALEARLPDLR